MRCPCGYAHRLTRGASHQYGESGPSTILLNRPRMIGSGIGASFTLHCRRFPALVSSCVHGWNRETIDTIRESRFDASGAIAEVVASLIVAAVARSAP